MAVRRLVLASANPHKAAEMTALLRGTGVKVVPRPAGLADVEETGATLEENARLKAVAVMEATGEAAVADDTGLEVEALGGAPGVYSARYAGEGATYEDNVRKLLAELEGVPLEGRRAQFRTVALVAFPDEPEAISVGVARGVITTEPRGTNGFGYDAVFLPDAGQGRTFAEMPPDEKNMLSHRAAAFMGLAQLL
ncbi:MAG TPA: RdgB/HAM1 family non-canonical purine NTP pyrophosphatase [Acidimicrobiales bacterium]|nr:RdgB/HAM1 family non-canonical purine NTP pyrophosphatase [Acidimicrobiales bacterium]